MNNDDDKYDGMTQPDFNRILEDLCNEYTVGQLLSLVPGVYEEVSEHFNNEVLARWEAEQEEICHEKNDTNQRLP